MKLNKYSLALILGLSTLVSCSDRMDLLNPNQQTSSTFGFNADDLEECVIAAYNHIRMEGSYARVGYTIDVCRGDEAWNSSQVWYLPFDDLNAEVTSDITWWPWREWYYTINVCNFTISRCSEDNSQLSDKMKYIKGQMLFLRGLSYYNLVGYYPEPAPHHRLRYLLFVGRTLWGQQHLRCRTRPDRKRFPRGDGIAAFAR